MIKLSDDYKNRVVVKLLEFRENYGGSDAAFSKKMGINNAVFSQIKAGKREGLLTETKWLELGRELDISVDERNWNMVRTAVFSQIEEETTFCQAYSKSMIFVDECEIGKTFAGKYLSKARKNFFYLDASQIKTKNEFIRGLAKVVGIDDTGRVNTVKANTKYYLKTLNKPLVFIDEPGDVNYETFLLIKEYWNSTEGSCAWYLTGADGLREKIDRGILRKKVGYREIFSRFSGRFSSIIPVDRSEKLNFYRRMLTDVALANIEDASKVGQIVKRCLASDSEGHIGGLRRLESLIILNS